MIGKAPRRWPSAKVQSEISEPNPYRARNRQPQIINDRMQAKPAIFALSRACIARGTGSSNPSPSSRQSVSLRISPWFLEKPGFSASVGRMLDGAVGRDAQVQQHRAEGAIVSLSGDIPVPQSRLGALQADAQIEVGLAM